MPYINTVSVDGGCCNEDKQAFNPAKFGFNKPRGRRSPVKIGKLQSPIPNEIRDISSVSSYFRESPFIPYSGFDKASSHALVCKLQEMKYLSPTKGAIMASLNTYAFGAKFKIFQSHDVDFDLGLEDVELIGNERLAYYNFLKSIDLGDDTYRSITEKVSDTLQTTGDAWAELVFSAVGAERFYKINYLNPAHVCYKFTETGAPRRVGISKLWSTEYCRKNPPRELPVYPNVEQQPDGSMRCVIHKKMGCFDYYGRPEDFSSFTDQYNEYNLRDYITKQINTAFIGNVFLEAEASETQKGNFTDNRVAQKNGYRNALDQIEDNFTNEGEDPGSLIAFNRDKEATPFKLQQIKSLQSESFYCKVGGDFRKTIIMANDWSEAILRKDKNSGFNSDMMKDIFDILSATKVLNHQICVGGFINHAIKLGADWLNMPEMANAEIRYQSPIQKLLQQKVEAEDGQTDFGDE